MSDRSRLDRQDHGYGSKSCEFCGELVYRTKYFLKGEWDGKIGHTLCMREVYYKELRIIRRIFENEEHPPKKDCEVCQTIMHRGKLKLQAWINKKTCCKSCAVRLRVKTNKGGQHKINIPVDLKSWGGGYMIGKLGHRHERGNRR